VIVEIPFKLPKLHPAQKDILQQSKRFNHLRCGRRFGKALVPETEIFTFNRGWITMGQIEPGDSVVSSSGKPCNVIAVTPIHKNQYFEIEFTGGEKVLACQDHQWITHSKRERKHGGRHIWAPRSVKTTLQISKTIKYGKKEYSHFVYSVAPIQYEFKPLPINPYILGLWLGDGSAGGARITIGDQDSKEILSLCADRGYPIRHMGGFAYTFSDGLGVKGKPSFAGYLRQLGILKQKRIPQSYLTADIESRFELLRGLNDSDGTASKTSNSVEFCNTNEILAKDYFELVSGLGFKASLNEGNSSIYGIYKGKKYRITYSTSKKVFNLKRKQNRLFRRESEQNSGRSIIKCLPIGENLGLCISVDSPDNSYCITRSFIVTHNTTLIEELSSIALEGKRVGIWFPTYKDLSEVWKDLKKTYGIITDRVNEQLKQIQLVTGGLIDFWSMEDPDSGQGRKYHRAIVDEAAKAAKLYIAWENTIRPTLTDYQGDAFIMSRPKGKNNGFYLMEEKHRQFDNWGFFHFTTYDNPYIAPSEIEEAKGQLDDINFRQEFLAEYVDANDQPFFYSFDEKKHVIESYEPNPHLPIICSLDFNKSPMTCLIGQQMDQWTVYAFDEIDMPDGSTPEVAELISVNYRRWMYNMDITGDATGRNRSALIRGNLNHYRVLKDILGLSDQAIRVPLQNLAHSDSRVLCNSVLKNANFFITKNCKRTIKDIEMAMVDDKGELIKNPTFPNHHSDTFRYLIAECYKDFIKHPEKYRRD